MKKLVTLLALTLVVSGCFSVGHKVDPSKVAQIKKGTTTKEEVIKLLGQPENISNTSDGVTSFRYVYAYSAVTGQSFIPYVGPFVAGTNTRTQNVTINFGPDNIVTFVESNFGSLNSGANLSADSGGTNSPAASPHSK